MSQSHDPGEVCVRPYTHLFKRRDNGGGRAAGWSGGLEEDEAVGWDQEQRRRLVHFDRLPCKRRRDPALKR